MTKFVALLIPDLKLYFVSFPSDKEMLFSGLALLVTTMYFGTKVYKKRPKKQKIKVLPPSVEPHNQADTEHEINKTLILATGTLGLRILGNLGYPFFTFLSIPSIVYIISIYLQRAYKELRYENKIGADSIDAIAWITMPILGYATLAAFYTSLVLIGKKIFIKTRDNSQQELANIFGEKIPRFVWIQQGQIERQIPFSALCANDIVVVHAGEIVPVDGKIITGFATINQNMLTGEAQPAEKCPGDTVFAATVILYGTIYIGVEKAGEETIASQIGVILNQTAKYKSPLESRGERIADKSSPLMLALSAVTLPILGPVSAITVLTSNPGYHMRITAPISVLNFLKLASKDAILVKDGYAFELLKDVDTIVFDKTGTLTQEQPYVDTIHVYNGYHEAELLAYAAAIEAKQTHPIAQAILQEAKSRELELSCITETTYEMGYGLKSKINGKLVCIGSYRFMEMENIALPVNVKAIQEDSYEHGYSLVYIAIEEHLSGVLELRPTIRPEAKGVIERLKQRGMAVYIISGDHQKPTQHLAHELDIEHYFAETLPENKAKLIEKLQQAGKKVCFVGDGINDAVALKKAEVAISLHGASTIATDTAQIILMDGSLNKLVRVFDLANNLEKNMKVNFMTSISPAILSIGGVYLLGISLGGALMFNYFCLMGGVGNAMLPVLMSSQSHQDKK
jgi:Cu2+-exporting ATPase